MPSFLVRCFNFAVMPLQVRNSFILFLCAVIWGSAFVAQALGMNHIGPFAFTFARSIIGGLFLLAVLPILDRLTRKKNETQNAPKISPWRNPKLWTGGILCGIVLFAKNFAVFAKSSWAEVMGFDVKILPQRERGDFLF